MPGFLAPLQPQAFGGNADQVETVKYRGSTRVGEIDAQADQFVAHHISYRAGNDVRCQLRGARKARHKAREVVDDHEWQPALGDVIKKTQGRNLLKCTGRTSSTRGGDPSDL